MSRAFPISIAGHLAFIFGIEPNEIKYDADRQGFFSTNVFPQTGKRGLFYDLSETFPRYSAHEDGTGITDYVETARDSHTSLTDGETADGQKGAYYTISGTVWGVSIKRPWDSDSDRFSAVGQPVMSLQVPFAEAKDVKFRMAMILIGKLATPFIFHGKAFEGATVTHPYEHSVDIYTLNFVADDAWIIRSDTGLVLEKYVEAKPTAPPIHKRHRL